MAEDVGAVVQEAVAARCVRQGSSMVAEEPLQEVLRTWHQSHQVGQLRA